MWDIWCSYWLLKIAKGNGRNGITRVHAEPHGDGSYGPPENSGEVLTSQQETTRTVPMMLLVHYAHVPLSLFLGY